MGDEKAMNQPDLFEPPKAKPLALNDRRSLIQKLKADVQAMTFATDEAETVASRNQGHCPPDSLPSPQGEGSRGSESQGEQETVTPLCRFKNQGWPRHLWSAGGVCERCGAQLPPLILKPKTTQIP